MLAPQGQCKEVETIALVKHSYSWRVWTQLLQIILVVDKYDSTIQAILKSVDFASWDPDVWKLQIILGFHTIAKEFFISLCQALVYKHTLLR